ncbi:efflux RND transporter periplasmic adaptor subunit [Bermanella sp. R86510]|uniref:efflux RND transporter periplasmic adaptor subunit n=1 Tax=unclassified Bermanella TaxID=2627862 RepID=UPI0037C86193
MIVVLIAGTVVATLLHASEDKHNHEHEQEAEVSSSEHQEQESHEDHDTHDQHNPDSDHSHSEHNKGNLKQHNHEEGGEKRKDDHGSHEGTTSASLNSKQMNLADIQVSSIVPKKVDYKLYAPGEVLSNGYTSYQVSPRVASVVLRRHVALGDHVKQGQSLATLFSELVASAQADYRIAWPEWQRVQELGRKAVGEQRYITAKTNLEAARATLMAYGLSASDLKSLVAVNQSETLGEYTLRAKIDGAVLSDDFEQGQRIEAGVPLIALADERKLWVEAHLPSSMTLNIDTGMQAEVVVGDVRVQASVTQEAHTIDPVTRTRTVRLSVNNPEHRLHPGQFAEVLFQFRTLKPILAVPETALMRSADGDWTVFVEHHPGEFKPVEVELGRALGTLREINGIEPGLKIVTRGAFFVASQIAKGGFDPHNH